MKLTLQTPGRTLLDGIEIEEVLVPGCKGMLGIYPGHSNFASELDVGRVKWRKPGSNEMETAVVTWGFIQIKDQHVSVLADVSELAHEIDKGRAETALSKAKMKLENDVLSYDEFDKYELKVKRAMARAE